MDSKLTLTPAELNAPNTSAKSALHLLANPLLTFAPTQPQFDFLKLNNFVQIYSGANWTGKTAITIVKLGSYLFKPTQNRFLAQPHILNFGQKSPHTPGRLRRHPNKLKGRIVSTHTSITQMIIPELHKWFPKGRYTAIRGSRAFEANWRTDTGAEFDLMTYDQDPREFESVKLHFVLFDEPPPYRIFAASVARMFPDGVIMIGMTPLGEAAYMFDRLNDPFTKSSRSWGCVYSDVEAMCTTHGRMGMLPHSDIERKIAEYDPEEAEARIHGRPMHLSGLIYKAFSRQKHVVPTKTLAELGPGTIYCVVDPHDRRPFAIGWYHISPNEKATCFDEWPNEPFHNLKSSSLTVSDYAQIIRDKEAEHGRSADVRLIDARYGKRQSSQTASSIRDMFDNEHLTFLDSYLDEGGSVTHGHTQVRSWLKPGSDNQPGFVIMESCRNHIYAFEHYVYDDGARGSVADNRFTKEKPLERGKDFCDLVRYFLMDDPRHVSTERDVISPEAAPAHWNRSQEPVGYGAPVD